ncbi:hypothetical protein MED193_11058 [Roseobacter sp. MED193]|nr:hypothetical protein MED193_11058 [Roseobacter sp. MED193]
MYEMYKRLRSQSIRKVTFAMHISGQIQGR